MKRFHSAASKAIRLLLCALLLPAAFASATPQAGDRQLVPQAMALAVPDAWEYVRLTPQQRHDLREAARLLPEADRRAHNQALMLQIRRLPDWLYEALSNERVAMDCRHDGMDDPLPLPPKLDAWAYVRLVPHQRYHFRLRARALDRQARAEYESHLAAELAKLPAWLRAALTEEAEREDARYGLALCGER